MKPEDLTIRAMTRAELDTLVEWAALEGWNPGLDDADAFWATDPGGFVAAESGGELIGGGSIVRYGTRFGFMGFFIVRKDRRHRGLGDVLWHERKRRLRARLDPDAPIGMDGVFDMQAYYARGGFRFVHRELRFEGRGAAGDRDRGVTELRELPFDTVAAYDARHFPARRDSFLRAWIARPNGHALGVVEGGALRGYAVMRPCRVGHKIGPLFADGPDVAERLFGSLAARVPGDPIVLDVPEVNPDALALARRHGMTEGFGCARMYEGPPPVLPDREIYGVTTFELG